jgi:hypothetical protein
MPHDYMMEDEDMSAPSMERKSSKETALLPKSFFPDSKEVEPGKICKVRVERVLEDEVEVSYVRKDKDDEDDEDETEVVEVEEEDEAYA